MNKISYMAAIILVFGILQVNAQTLTNKGAEITINNGSQLFIDGDFENKNDGAVNNSGDIYISGNWFNNATSGNLLQGTIGQLSFNGTSQQIIGGSAKTWFNDINVQSDIDLAVNTNVSGIVQFNSSIITLNSYFIILENTASITGANSNGYVVADDAGRLVQEVGNSDVFYPVGTTSFFTPLIIENDGVVDNFGVNVFEDVLDGGTSGSTIPEIEHCVNLSWHINEQINGGSDLSITPFWSNINEGPLFDRSVSGVGHYNAGNWEPQAVQDASGIAPYSITRTGITNVSTFAVGDINSPMVIQLDLVIDLSVFLEGPFNGSSMKTNLNVQGLIPLAQPYFVSPWNYAGTEQVVSFPNTNIVDWIFLELRDAPSAASADETTIISQQAGFILHDGSVVAIDGFSDMQFNATISQNLFVVVYHRNHLGIMSSNPLPQTDGNYSYNFTTDAYQAWGSSDPQKEIATGIFGMYGGDLNSNGIIGSSDRTAWEDVTGTAGYITTDANFDGQVNNPDKNDFTIQNIDEQSYIPE